MHKKKEEKRLKEAICEFYLFAKKLQAYQELNFTAFRKINKKHDKIMNSEEGEIRMSQIVISRSGTRRIKIP
jgi:SPX domain protein involved in polyphosphate accumulation